MSSVSNQGVYRHFATSDGEAAKRFCEHKNFDPFPDIEPALLNSSDVGAYIRQTGMVYPYDPNANHKSASIAIKLQGRVIYWDGECKHDFILSSDILDGYPKKKWSYGYSYKQSMTLRKNSIAFLTLEPRLRLPNYIAARFNLKIKDVYRGLLLGTGPLVDPGYSGHLSIPLHNLTNNDYEFAANEVIAWMEFTKVSPFPEWNPKYHSPLDGRFKKRPEFPIEKNQRRDIEDYLAHALVDEKHDKVTSSIPEVMVRIETIVNRITTYGPWAASVAVIAVIAALFTMHQAYLSEFQSMAEQIKLMQAATSQQEKSQQEDFEARLGRLETWAKSLGTP